MPGASGYEIVREALAYRDQHPNASALQVLDTVFDARRGADPDFDASDFGYDDWLYPPSPFAELLRQAFAPDISEHDVAILGMEQSTDPMTYQRLARMARLWEENVIEALAERYSLWVG